MRMEGDYFAHEYCLYEGARQMMLLSKQWFTWGDSYELSISQPQDELLCLCVTLAMDCAMEQQSNSN